MSFVLTYKYVAFKNNTKKSYVMKGCKIFIDIFRVYLPLRRCIHSSKHVNVVSNLFLG